MASGWTEWTDEDRDLAQMMIALGMSHVDTGSAVGRTNKAIATALCRGHLTPAPDVQRLDLGASGDRRPWTEDEETLVALLAQRGWESHAMGRLLGRTWQSVQTRKSRLGIVGVRYKSMQKPAATTRACMCCARGFRSEGSHNRICEPCKGTEIYRLAS